MAPRRDENRVPGDQAFSRYVAGLRGIREESCLVDAVWLMPRSVVTYPLMPGKATAAEHGHGLDGDVLIAAQAIAEDAAFVTTNPCHLQPLVRAMEWHELVARES